VGYEAVVKLLLTTDQVGLDSKGKDRRTSLSWAREYGHKAVVKLLATDQVDPDSTGRRLYRGGRSIGMS